MSVDQTWFCWTLCDPDAKPGTTLREGQGFDSLTDALRDLTSREQEHTPTGYIPGGNVALYWYHGATERAS